MYMICSTFFDMTTEWTFQSSIGSSSLILSFGGILYKFTTLLTYCISRHYSLFIISARCLLASCNANLALGLPLSSPNSCSNRYDIMALYNLREAFAFVLQLYLTLISQYLDSVIYVPDSLLQVLNGLLSVSHSFL